MSEPTPQIPNYLVPTLLPPPPSPLPQLEPDPSCPSPSKPNPLFSLPSLRVTSEFDSDSSIFFHKVSCKLFDNLAKLKLSFINNSKREISEPRLALTTKYLSIHYDPQEQNALIKSSFDVGPMLHFKAAHDVKAQQGEVAVIGNLADPSYAVEVTSPVPNVGWPRATIKFPMGEVTFEEREDEEMPSTMSINGTLKAPILNGVCAAHYKDEELNLKYSYKDGAISFIPSISFPSNAVSFAFKRRFGSSKKLSYWYKLDSNYWNAVYKHTYDKDYKFKVGYDSEVRLGWASLWVGMKMARQRQPQ